METPASHTLAGVLTRLRLGAVDDPMLSAKLDRAFAKHVAGIRRYCGSELRGFSPQVVEEVAQDVLTEAWRKLPTYEPTHPFRAFLFGIATRLCANLRRKRRDALTEDGVVDPASPERSALGSLVAAERDALVETAAANVLDPTDQELVHLRWVLDYPYDEIARQLELPGPDAVRVALQRSRRRMERELERLLASHGQNASFLRPSG
ncbi:MAG: sigma-70 family RNA polymerase sigma factor [Myxococcota bacterium]